MDTRERVQRNAPTPTPIRPAAKRQACRAWHKPGDICPDCGDGTLAYDGLFRLVCPVCGRGVESGGFT